MKSLCLDSSHKYLTVVLIEDDKIVKSYEEECFKKQSEKIFPVIIELFNDVNWKANDLDKIVVSVGPGSYTGIRIAMSIAKVLATQLNIKLYTVSSLALYAGNSTNSIVVMDARSNRAYCGIYNLTKMIKEEILELDMIKAIVDTYDNKFGDLELVDLTSDGFSLADNFLILQDRYELVENPHNLVPKYLKESDSYKV